MNVVFDQERLLQLIGSLHILTGFRANIFDRAGNDICLEDNHSSFCARINDCPEGHARCVSCDAQGVRLCEEGSGFRFYRCHAGICEAILPIRAGGTPLAYLVFGQFLDSSPREEQWAATAETLGWFPGGAEALREDFDRLRQYSDREIAAYSEVLGALAAYIQLQGMILTIEQTDLQKLEFYLDQHYMEKLSLASISRQLNIGRTKLCSLAKQLSGGHTLTYLIAQRRVSAAKALLLQSDLPISAVAEAVGVSDYNYFSKMFRAATGATPSAFRKAGRYQAGPA